MWSGRQSYIRYLYFTKEGFNIGNHLLIKLLVKLRKPWVKVSSSSGLCGNGEMQELKAFPHGISKTHSSRVDDLREQIHESSMNPTFVLCPLIYFLLEDKNNGFSFSSVFLILYRWVSLTERMMERNWFRERFFSGFLTLLVRLRPVCVYLFCCSWAGRH